MLHFILSVVQQTQDPTITVAYIMAGQAILLAVIAIIGKMLLNRANTAREAAKTASATAQTASETAVAATAQIQGVSDKISTNNGRTMGQYVELISKNVELLGNTIDLLDQKIDRNHEVVMGAQQSHSDDDQARFLALEEAVKNKNASSSQD